MICQKEDIKNICHIYKTLNKYPPQTEDTQELMDSCLEYLETMTSPENIKYVKSRDLRLIVKTLKGKL